ncbi:MAG: HNH endonuclease signature motif containing protein, partial [Stellaceae bacterium]
SYVSYYLQGDHIWPYSLLGETTWENYQLICGDCNLKKGNRLQIEIRRVLGTGEFRSIISAFLMNRVKSGKLSNDRCLENILGGA